MIHSVELVFVTLAGGSISLQAQIELDRKAELLPGVIPEASDAAVPATTSIASQRADKALERGEGSAPTHYASAASSVRR